MKKPLLFVLCTFFLGVAQGQLNINTIGTAETIDFTGYDGSGFTTTPSTGQLSSNTWEVLGLDDGDLLFGTSQTGNDFALGTSTGGTSQGGIYSFDNGTTGESLGVQAAGSDFTPGSYTLKIENATGSTIDDIDLSYVVWTYNDEGRSSDITFSHGSDNMTFTTEASLSYISPEAAAGSPTWNATTKTITLSGVSISAGAVYYLKWSSDDVAGSGSRDEIALDDISVTGQTATATPTITVNPNSLIGFSYAEGTGPSAEQTFDVSGSDLTNDITLTAPTNFEISQTSGSGFGSSITLPQSSGSVATTTIYVRLASGLLNANSPFNGDIAAASTGATTENISLDGTVSAAATPTISANPMMLTGFSYLEGNGPSMEQNFDVGGTDLNDDIVLNAPTNYEISQTSGSGFTGSITLTQTSGSVATTTIYVRLISGLLNANSPFNADIDITSTGATAQTVSLEGEVTSSPTVTATPTMLTGFTYDLLAGSGPSTEQNFTVEGSNLTNDLIVEAPVDFEVSATASSGYSSNISFTSTGGTVSPTTVYVRMKALLSAGVKSGAAVVKSNNAVNDSVFLEGEVIAVGIEEETKKNGFKVYPNPFKNQLNITLDNKINQAAVKVVDVLGKTIYSKTILSNKQIKLNATAGVYFITVTIDGHAKTMKVIKN